MAFARGSPGKLAVAALAITLAVGWMTPARAAPRHAFNVAAQPLIHALLDFAIQANISIGTAEASGCQRASHGARGVFTLAAALDKILAGTGCGYRMIDASSVRVVRLPSAAAPIARPAARPTAPTSAGSSATETATDRAAVPEVVVTATRRSGLTLSLPDTISVVSGARLALDRDTGVADLASLAAGLTVTNLGPGSDKLIIRGLSDGGLTGHAQSTVGVYLDDTRLTYNAPDPDLRLADIDQVEVLQGPQGALYGAGSIAGVVHIVTRQPNLDQYSGMAQVQAAATASGGPSGAIEAMANLPLDPDRLALRIVAWDEHDGGYIDDVKIGRKNTNSTDRDGGRAAVKLIVNPDWSVDIGVVHQTLASADSQYATPHLGAYQRNVNLEEPHSNNFDALHVTVAGDTAPGQFKNTLSLVNHIIDTRYDATSALPQFIAAPPAPAAFNEADRITTLVDEATLTSVGASPLQWQFGAFGSDSRQGLDSAITTTPPGAAQVASVYVERRSDAIEELALYGEATYDLTDRLAAGAGLRLGAADIETNSIVRAPLSGGQALFRGSMLNLQWEPKLSLRYRISDQVMGYVLASEGVRSGGFNTGGPIGTVFSGPGGSSEPFRRFAGDALWNVEAGIKARALTDRLDIRAVAFYAVWDNIQSDQLLPSGLVYTANIGDGRNVGVEGELAYALGDFDLRVASMLDEPELTRHALAFPTLVHSGLPGAPRGSVGTALHYQRRGDGPVRPFFDAAVDYVGQSRLNFDARLSRRMGDYTVARLTGGADDGDWRIAAFLDNPLAVTGNTFAYGNPFTLRQTRQITPLQPRTAGLQLTRAF